MTKPGETTGFQVSDHVREINKYLGKDAIDYVICASNHFSDAALQKSVHNNQIPVQEPDPKKLKELTRAKIIWADVASESELVRHDSLKLAAEIKNIIEHENKSR